MKPYDFKWTKFYESNLDFPYSGLQPNLAENELIICSTIIDADNYSILTTRRLITKQEGQINIGDLTRAVDKLYDDFKGYKDKAVTLGHIQLQNGSELKYFIETGKASMIMIYGVRTLIGTTQMTNKQIDNVTKIWDEQDEN
ncbi:MAG: hypothetical protein KF862_02365 [Chitinophagaceae bacterium]|nr:hypothetical protein [Chitinophagaceae bacterium]